MSGGIKIPVQAAFDSSSVEQQLQAFQQKLNALGQQIAQANKAQFNPVSKTSLQDMQKMVQQFEALRRVSGDLNKRINATGQKGRSFVDLDWGSMYPDTHSRARQQAKAFQYVTGHAVVPPAPGPRPPPNQPPGGGWAQAGVGAVQAGLRAAGPVGGVASGALGTGMSAGFGAGMMGLMGGMLALGVGKLVGAAVEKIGQAEDNSVAYDKIKRTLGDVNVSFSGLKSALEGASGNLKITFDEAARLSMQFAKLGNLTNDRAGSLQDELRTGVGMSRSLGLDPSQGVGFLGTMRGMKQTQDEQGSRKMALLIGETIAKSNAFAKSDEVMEAISSYVTSQTRASHGANVGGYAGMFSSMVGSGIAGMDPTGAAGMLGKINSSLMGGGAKGEASQFFTAMVGQRMGLDPLQTQLLREGGAFATPDQVFGKGSIYERATGRTGPGGSQNFLSGTRGLLDQAYGGNSEQSIMLRAQATANHLGINMTQAMALGTLQPNQMGDLEGMLKNQGLKIGDINMGGLASLSKVVSGTSDERLGVASQLWSRTGKDALSKPERDALDKVMKEGSEQEQKEMLSALVATRDQEMTQGKDIRDSKTALENIKTTLADQLLPVTQSMRDGIMWMAGGKDGKSSQTIREDMAKADITEGYQRKIDAEKAVQDQARDTILNNSTSPSDREAARKRLADAPRKIRELEQQRDKDIGAAVSNLRTSPDAPYQDKAYDTPEGWRAPGGAPAAATQGGAGIDAKLSAADAKYGLPPGTMKSIMRQETGGRSAEFLADPGKYHYGLDANGRRVAPHTGKISTAFGPFGILESTAAKPGYGVSPLKDKGFDSQLDFAASYASARIKSAGSVRGGLAGYGEGSSYADSVTSRLPNGTPMPEDALAAKRSGESQTRLRGSFDDLSITINGPDNKRQQVSLQPRFNIPVFGQA